MSGFFGHQYGVTRADFAAEAMMPRTIRKSNDSQPNFLAGGNAIDRIEQHLAG